MVIDYNTYNRDVRGWGQNTRRKLISSVNRLSQKGKGDLVKKISMKSRVDFGLVDRLSYTFPRHGVFFHKGVGKGYKMIGGKLTRVPGKSKVLSDESVKREAVDWFNPIINNNIDDLANRVANHMADAAVNATRLKIN